jgi:hypothetical protein
VRGGEGVADEARVRVLQAARLAALPQAEGVDDLLAGEVDAGPAQALVLGLHHVDVEREVVADDDVGAGEDLEDLVGALRERGAVGQVVHRDAVHRLGARADGDRRLESPGPAAALALQAALDAELDDLVLAPIGAGGLDIEDQQSLGTGTELGTDRIRVEREGGRDLGAQSSARLRAPPDNETSPERRPTDPGSPTVIQAIDNPRLAGDLY